MHNKTGKIIGFSRWERKNTYTAIFTQSIQRFTDPENANLPAQPEALWQLSISSIGALLEEQEIEEMLLLDQSC